MPKKTPTPKKKRAARLPSRVLAHRLPALRDALTQEAPPGFTVAAHFEPRSPWLWIGLHSDPHKRDSWPGRFVEREAGITCYGVITGEALRQLAIDILRCYPSDDGGAK